MGDNHGFDGAGLSITSGGVFRKSNATDAQFNDDLKVYTKQRLMGELTLLEKIAPGNRPVYVSSDWAECEKMLVIVTKSDCIPGVWDNDALLSGGLDVGSMFPYFQKAVYQGFGLLVLNPGTLNRGGGIPETSTRQGHLQWGWREFVPPTAAVVVVFPETTGDLVWELTSLPNGGNGGGIKAVALTESPHTLTSAPPALKLLLAGHGVNWCASSSHVPPAVSMDAGGKGCLCLSAPAGPPGCTAGVVVNQVFSFFKHSLAVNSPDTSTLIEALTAEEAHNVQMAQTTAADEKVAAEEEVVMKEEAAAVAEAAAGGQQEDEGTEVPSMSRETTRRIPGTAAFGTEKKCYICNRRFLPWRRRHHCRICIGAVDDKCSPDRLFLVGRSTAQRVCVKCASMPDDQLTPNEAGGVQKDTSLNVESFDLLKVVGKGAFGKVMLVRKKEGLHAGEVFAMKVLKKAHVFAKKQVDHTKSERRILRELTNPFVVRLRFAFQSEDKLYLVMDYYSGGSLFFHLRKVRFFSEVRSRFYAAELLLALDYLHSLHIVYRDLKLENILLDRSGHLALTDFGLSKEDVTLPDGAETFCGTAEYIAPELLKGKPYGAAVDWWSFGILLYEMMTGVTPFFSRNRKQMFHDIVNRKLTFPLSFSPDARSLLTGLLQRDPGQRLGTGSRGAQDIKDHPFFAAVDWVALENKRIEPPFKPRIASLTDTNYVPKPYVNELAQDTPPNAANLANMPEAAQHFNDFTFVGDSNLHGR